MDDSFPRTVQRMATKEILPSEVVSALDDLTTQETKELFFHLKINIKTLDDIDANHAGTMRKIHYVQTWLDQDVGASWEKIVAGLKLMGMKALAETLATQKCLGGTPTSAAVNLTPDLPSSPATAPEASGPETSGSSPSDPSLGPMAHPLSPSSPSDRVSQVRAEIDSLSDTFSDLMSNTRKEMCKKEDANPIFLDKFRDCLLDLPVSQKAPHAKFFQEKLDDFLNAESMQKIFAILRFCCNYRNHKIVQEVVRKFCNILLQRKMQEYCESLEKFEKETTVDVYLEAIEASDVLASEFTKITMKINKPASQCTLHEARKTAEDIAERASLHLYSVYLGEISKSSVQLELGFPASCVGWIVGAMTPNFLTTHFLSGVTLGKQKLLTLDLPQEELVC